MPLTGKIVCPADSNPNPRIKSDGPRQLKSLRRQEVAVSPRCVVYHLGSRYSHHVGVMRRGYLRPDVVAPGARRVLEM